MRGKWRDITLSASTCENFPIILLEAMISGIPIASSYYASMPEILKDSALYFNPESISSIKKCIRYMVENKNLLKDMGEKTKIYSQAYTWKKCADETFSFLYNIYEKNKT